MRALLVVLLLAGCVAPAAAPEEPAPNATATQAAVELAPASAPLTPPPLAGLKGLALHTGHGASEPTLGVGRSGALFVTGYAGPGVPINAAPAVLRSRDGGATWTDVGPRLPGDQKDPPYTGDPYLTVDAATGRVFSADLTSFSCMSLVWSDDEGESWFANPAACSLTSGFIDHPSLVAAKPRVLPTVGYPSVLHVCFNSVTDARCARSLDGGLTFGPARPLAVFTPHASEPDSDCFTALTGRLQASPDGTVWLPYVEACTGRPMVAVSRDDGLTWAAHAVSTERPGDVGTYNDHEAVVAVEPSGRAWALWLSGGLPYVASSDDLGASWSPARLVAPPEVTATDLPAIAARDGRVVVAYLGTTAPGGYAERPMDRVSLLGDYAPRDEDDWRNVTWNAYLGVLLPDGNVTTVTANDPQDPLARGACGRMRCAEAGGDLGMGDFIGLVLDADGHPWASFVDACTRGCATDPGVGNDVNEGLVATLAWPKAS